MVPSPNLVESEPLQIHFGPILKQMDDHDFFEFCQLNQEIQLELTRDGDLVISPLNGGTDGHLHFEVSGLLAVWVDIDGSGVGFSSTTGFRLPNGAMRSPDLSWVKKERWNALSKEEKDEFPPLCPDFVGEIRSLTENKYTLIDKMREYMENGAQLGWLLDPIDQQVMIFRPDTEVETIHGHAEISGEPLLKGFVLDTRKLW